MAIFASVYCLITSYQASPDFLDFITSIDNRQLPRGHSINHGSRWTSFHRYRARLEHCYFWKYRNFFSLESFTAEMQNKKSILRTYWQVFQLELRTHRFTRSQFDGASLNILAIIIKWSLYIMARAVVNYNIIKHSVLVIALAFENNHPENNVVSPKTCLFLKCESLSAIF